MKKNLEDKIIRNIYVMETKRMSLSFVVRLLSFIFFGGAAFLLIQVLLEVLSEEKTLDVLTIFNDDVEIVGKYLGDIANVIFQETPKGLLLAIAASLAVVLFVVLTFITNFGKMRHKLTAVLRYWQHQ